MYHKNLRNIPDGFRKACEDLKGKKEIAEDKRKGILLYIENWCAVFECTQDKIILTNGIHLPIREYTLEEGPKYFPAIEKQQEYIEKYRQDGYITLNPLDLTTSVSEYMSSEADRPGGARYPNDYPLESYDIFSQEEYGLLFSPLRDGPVNLPETGSEYRACLYCKKPLINPPINKTFCSKKCYYKYNRAKDEYEKDIELIKKSGMDLDLEEYINIMQGVRRHCKNCGRDITDITRSGAKFCPYPKYSCRDDYHNKRRKRN